MKIRHQQRYTWAQSYSVSTQQPSALLLWSLMALLHQHGHLCSVEQGCTPCRDTCVWSMELWLGVIQLPEELAYTSCSPSPKLWIITLSVCQHLSSPQEEPVTHSCFIPVTLASHAPPGGSAAPEGYVYNSICVLISKRKLLGKRMRRILYNTARTKLDFADATWLTKSPLQ